MAFNSLYSWPHYKILVVFLSFLIVFNTLGQLFSFGVFFNYIIKLFNSSKSETSWIISLAQCFWNLSGIPVSLFIKYYGIQISSFVGTCLFSLGFLLSSFASELWHYYLTYSIFIGISMQFSFAPCLFLVSYLFDDQYRPLAIAITSSGSGLGTFVWALIYRFFLDSYSLNNVFLIIALISFILSFIPSIFLQNIKQQLKTSELSESSESSDKKAIFNYKIFIQNKGFVLFLIGAFFLNFGIFGPLVFIVDAFENSIGIDRATFLVSCQGIGSLVGCLIVGFLVKKFGLFQVFITSNVIFGVLCFFYIFLSDYYGLIVTTLLIGFFNGCFVGILSVIILKFVGIENLTFALGISWTFTTPSMLSGTPLAGFLVDVTQNFSFGFAYCGIMILSFLPFFLSAIYVQSTNKQEKPEDIEFNIIKTSAEIIKKKDPKIDENVS